MIECVNCLFNPPSLDITLNTDQLVFALNVPKHLFLASGNIREGILKFISVMSVLQFSANETPTDLTFILYCRLLCQVEMYFNLMVALLTESMSKNKNYTNYEKG